MLRLPDHQTSIAIGHESQPLPIFNYIFNHRSSLSSVITGKHRVATLKLHGSGLRFYEVLFHSPTLISHPSLMNNHPMRCSRVLVFILLFPSALLVHRRPRLISGTTLASLADSIISMPITFFFITAPGMPLRTFMHRKYLRQVVDLIGWRKRG